MGFPGCNSLIGVAVGGGYEVLARVCWEGLTGLFGFVWLTGWSLLLGNAGSSFLSHV